MIRRPLALCAMLLALCGAAERPPPPGARLCRLERSDSTGTINLYRRMDHDPPGMTLYWHTPYRAVGLSLFLFWPSVVDPLIPPADNAAVHMSYLGVRLHGRPGARVELRRVSAADDALVGERTFRGDRLELIVPLGRLRAFAAGGPLTFAIADRTGRVMAETPFDPAVIDQARAAAIAAAPEWQAMTADPDRRCEPADERPIRLD